MSGPLKVGAVLYDPKVSVIWEIIRNFFESRSVPIDVTFYNTYELQVSSLLDGTIDVAWNSPLAWLDAQRRSGGTCRAIAMRDTDRDRVSYIVGRKDGPVRRVPDLRGHVLAVGASDSPQATLIPLGLLRQEGLEPRRDVKIRGFDVLVGKHGDHVGGELDAYWNAWTRDGTVDPGEYAVIAPTDLFDHWVFTVRAELGPDAERRWLDALFSMRYDEPSHREMMDLEGLTAWMPGRMTGFRALTAAVAAERFFERQPSGT
jgi:ABC-type phosphate/phosphonate transport system substrate-binding protein